MKLRSHKPTALNPQITRGEDAFTRSDRRRHVCFGDSLTAGNQDGTGVSYPSVLSALMGSGVAVTRQGYGGYTSTEVGVVQGGVPIVVGAFTLPTGTTATPITVTSPTGVFQTGTNTSFTWTGTLAGQNVTVTRTLDGSGNATWTASRTGSVGFTTAVPSGSQFVCSVGSVNVGDVLIVMVGRNNVSTSSTIISDVQAMIARLTPKLKRYLVLPVLKVLSEHVGDPSYATVQATNAAIAAAFGANFWDANAYLIGSGLSVDNLTANALDTTDIAGDTIPRQLKMNDGVHLNQLGYRALAWGIYQQLKSFGWVPDAAGTLPTLNGYRPTDMRYLYKASTKSGLADGTAVTGSIADDAIAVGSQTLAITGGVTKETNSDGTVLRLNGTNAYLTVTDNDAVSSIVIRARVRALPTTGNHFGLAYTQVLSGPVFQFDSNGGSDLYAGSPTLGGIPSGTVVPGTTQTFIAVLNGANSAIRIGATESVGATGALPWQNSRIGYNGTGPAYSPLDIYEIVIYNRPLNAAERAALVAYYGGT